MARWIIVAAGLNGAMAVAMGAGSAHGFSSFLPADQVAWIKTGAEYQLWHALLLALIAALSDRVPRLSWAGIAVVTGILLFSGSLYVLGFTGLRAVAAVTPFGGLSLIVGWLLLAWFGGRAVVEGQSKGS